MASGRCVCSALGIDSSDYSFGYVAGWSGGGDEAAGGADAAVVGGVLGSPN
jgi:hypothetical protein